MEQLYGKQSMLQELNDRVYRRQNDEESVGDVWVVVTVVTSTLVKWARVGNG